mmetsp:Transcript_38164/g.83014  ORF Transcript_38164/g.83014 Transcript_38164/m.83014 type:complete len:180 (+) Transcript_38164:451-990(+)
MRSFCNHESFVELLLRCCLVKDVISQLGITHVLSIGPDSLVALENDSPIVRRLTPSTATGDLHYEYEDEGVHYMILAVEDAPETSLLNYLHGCFQFIDSALKPSSTPAKPYKVLVSCWEGKSASVTVLASYLIVREKKQLAYVMGLIRDVHPDAEPNIGFSRNLRYLDRNSELPEWVIP